MQGDREECLSVGMNGYSQKPIRQQDILSVFQQCPPSHIPQSNPHQLKSAGTLSMNKLSPTRTNKTPQTSSGELLEKTMGDRTAVSITNPGHELILVANDILTLDTTSLESFSHDRSFLAEVFESFLTDAPNRIQELEIALKHNNKEALTRTAHALKSLSSCIGAMRLFKICQSIEIASREGIDIVTAAISEQISMEYNNVQSAIQEYTSA